MLLLACGDAAGSHDAGGAVGNGGTIGGTVQLLEGSGIPLVSSGENHIGSGVGDWYGRPPFPWNAWCGSTPGSEVRV